MSEDEAPNGEKGPIVTARISSSDAVRLDRVAARRGIDRGELIAEAIDEFLAQEALSGRFVAPPPPMLIPSGQ